jgi:hypothetical protein
MCTLSSPCPQTRARLWLLVSFVLAFGAVAGSVGVLVSSTAAGSFVAVGVASVLQCGLLLASALLFWAFRSGGDNAGYSYM